MSCSLFALKSLVLLYRNGGDLNIILKYIYNKQISITLPSLVWYLGIDLFLQFLILMT